MSEVQKTPVRFFYWQIRFTDNTIISQFDEQGNEVYMRDFIPKSCWVLQKNGSLSLDYNSNWFELLEHTHGKVVKVSWMPFTEDLKKKCQEKQSSLDIEVVNEYRCIERRIPKDCFGHIAWSNNIKHGVEMDFSENPDLKSTGIIYQYQSVLFIGYLPRDDAILLGRRGKIDQIKIEERPH